MTSLTGLLENARAAELLALLDPGADCHLVGGALRNHLLGLPVTDFDFATPEDPTALAQAFAERIDGRWFSLDAGRRQSRVILRQKGRGNLSFDFAPYRAVNLESDLLLRDFSINALAFDLRRHAWHDPLDGRGDLQFRRLRTCGNSSFADDPLRILRLVRLAITLDFRVEPAAMALARTALPLLGSVAGERLGDELTLICNTVTLPRAVQLLADLDALAVLFPGTRPKELRAEVLDRDLAELESFADQLAGVDPLLSERLAEPVGRGLRRIGRLRLTVLGRQLPNFSAADLQQRLCLGWSTVYCVANLVLARQPDLAELHGLGRTARARALWAEAGGYPVDRLLLLAAGTGEGRRELLLECLRSWLACQVAGRVPALIDGDQLRQSLGLEAGPVLGKLLKLLATAECRGEITTAQQALELARYWQEKSVDKKNDEAL